jgi:hypothetical protein
MELICIPLSDWWILDNVPWFVAETVCVSVIHGNIKPEDFGTFHGAGNVNLIFGSLSKVVTTGISRLVPMSLNWSVKHILRDFQVSSVSCLFLTFTSVLSGRWSRSATWWATSKLGTRKHVSLELLSGQPCTLLKFNCLVSVEKHRAEEENLHLSSGNLSPVLAPYIKR